MQSKPLMHLYVYKKIQHINVILDSVLDGYEVILTMRKCESFQ